MSTNIQVKIIKDNYNKDTEIRLVTFQYKTDFNQLIIKTSEVNDLFLDGYELQEYLVQLIPTYHCK